MCCWCCSFFSSDLSHISGSTLDDAEQDVLDKKCSSAAICFVTFLPDILDSTAAGRKKYLDTLLTVAEKFKRSAYRYLQSLFHCMSKTHPSDCLSLLFFSD